MKIGKFVTHATPEAGNFSTKIRNSNASLPSAKEISGLRFELGSDLWKCVQLIIHHKKKKIFQKYTHRDVYVQLSYLSTIFGEKNLKDHAEKLQEENAYGTVSLKDIFKRGIVAKDNINNQQTQQASQPVQQQVDAMKL